MRIIQKPLVFVLATHYLYPACLGKARRQARGV